MNIVYNWFPSESTDQVAVAADGSAACRLSEGGGAVECFLLMPREQRFQQLMSAYRRTDYGFSRVATRRHFRLEHPESTTVVPEMEALFANIRRNRIDRMSGDGLASGLDLTILASSVTALRASQDGRYIAIGNGDGQFELWNMDMKPQRYYSFGFTQRVAISDLCYSRTNLDLLVSTTYGTMFYFDMARDRVHTLNDDERRWPCYSIDTQHGEGHGIVFGGEGSVLWFLNTRTHFYDESVHVHEVPFLMQGAVSHTGAQYMVVQAMPHASIGCIRTGVGSYVHQVRFLTDDLVCAVGPNATEVYRLERGHAQLVRRRTHDADSRIFGIGGDAETVNVCIGR